ncbi:hypothetical protein PG996_009259 [Apiospora saccharicola]|uniref:Uncharacterized protein n=1 Tax=Apiospora saccharicola TaxID=335842 RepID=A0ABR1UNA6_9PEZI
MTFHASPLSNKDLAKQKTKTRKKEKTVKPGEESPASRENIGAKKGLADFELTGKVFVVTGGGQGLGLALAEALVEAGGKVYYVDRTPEPDEAWQQAQERVVPEWGGSLHYRQHDYFKQDAPDHEEQLDRLIQSITEENGHLDGLSAARQMLTHNTRGTIVLVAHLSSLVANKGLLSAVPNSPRAALVQLARDLATRWSPINPDGSGGIRVNCISPDNILTPVLEAQFVKDPGLKEYCEKDNMMGRLADNSEFKGAVLFLSSKASSFMTGGNRLVDGGKL